MSDVRFLPFVFRLLAFVLCLLAWAAQPCEAQFSASVRLPVERRDFFLQLRDGAILDCAALYPAATPPAKGWPCLILCHGYADSKEMEIANAEAQAAYGYYMLVFSMRGQGISGGRSRLISRTEMDDLIEVVEAAKRDTLVNPRRVGLFGGSQGGILPFMAACNGLDARCIIADFASPEFATSWIENGCVKMTLFFTVDYDSLTVRYHDDVRRIRGWILSGDSAAWDSLAAALPRDRDFAAQVPACAVPIMTENAWQDEFFNAAGMIRAIAKLPVPFRAYIGAMDGHGADSTFRENQYISRSTGLWLDYWLYDRPTGILDSAGYHFASSHQPKLFNRWAFSHERSDVWPPSGVAPRRWYFHADSALRADAPSAAFDTVALRNDLRDTALTMQQAIDARFTGPAFATRFPKHTRVFDTDALAEDYQLIGAPRLHLWYSSTARVCQYNFQLWELRPNGQADFVTRLNFTDRRAQPGGVRDTVVEGLAHAHIFRAGNRIRIVLTNLDTQQEDRFLRTNPHVLPILTRSVNTMFVDALRASSIELPGKTVVATGTPAAAPPSAAIALDLPAPHPVRGPAVIRFSLRGSTPVRVDVFDALGRHAGTLLDASCAPGAYALPFDGARFAPGLYLAVVTAEGERRAQKFLITH